MAGSLASSRAARGLGEHILDGVVSTLGTREAVGFAPLHEAPPVVGSDVSQCCLSVLLFRCYTIIPYPFGVASQPILPSHTIWYVTFAVQSTSQ